MFGSHALAINTESENSENANQTDWEKSGSVGASREEEDDQTRGPGYGADG